jgi:peroxiredoxin
MITKRNLFAAMVTAISVTSSINAAEIDKAAPDFTVKDVKGATVSLAGLKGKTVVLEWINFGCPFVIKHYKSNNMQKLQETYTAKDVVWISVNSASKASGVSLEDAAFLKMAEEQKSKATHLVCDLLGVVGKAYDAKTTPHMFIINKEGTLVYNGAIDSMKSTDEADIPKSENYIAKALDAVLSGKAVETGKTEPYGCGVKY